MWEPSPADRWHVQYAGELAVPDGADVVDLDMEETPASVIAGLQLVDDVEFQVDEECIALDECDALDVFVDAGKPVWSIEYEGDPDVVCARAAELGFATWIKDLSSSAGGHECPVPEGEVGAGGGGR